MKRTVALVAVLAAITLTMVMQERKHQEKANNVEYTINQINLREWAVECFENDGQFYTKYYVAEEVDLAHEETLCSEGWKVN